MSWISIEQKLPEKGKLVIFSDGHDMCLGSYDYFEERFVCHGSNKHDYFEWECLEKVKFWTDIPELPKDKK